MSSSFNKTESPKIFKQSEALSTCSSDTFNIDPQLIDILGTQSDFANASVSRIISDTKNLEEIPINEFISLVLKERNISFKDLTAESLLGNKEEDDFSMEEDEKKKFLENSFREEEVSSLTLEQFEKLKKESLHLINNAINESSLLLEMISLLISGVKPKQGILSMSPFLKQHLPMGTLNSDTIPMKQLSNNGAVESYLIKMAWKLQSLTDIQDYYHKNYEKLKKQISIENKYWSLISDVQLINKHSFVKNAKNNSISLKYGINGNQIASLNIVDIDLDTIEMRLTPSINAHKLNINNSSEKRNLDTIFKYVKVEVHDKETGVIESVSQLADGIKEILVKSLQKNYLVDQLNRLNEFQLNELLFNTLKHECKQNTAAESEIHLVNDATIEVETTGKYKIIIKYESLLVQELEENTFGSFNSKFADDLLKFMFSNLQHQNILRAYNNLTNNPVYYSKKPLLSNKANVHNILFNLLYKINHKCLIKRFIKVFESNSIFSIKNVSLQSEDISNQISLSNSDCVKLKKMKMTLNTYIPLISKPRAIVLLSSAENEYAVEISLKTTSGYSLVLQNDTQKKFNNITELLDYLIYISDRE
ncbi:hypothetical protein QEN19_000814 [Hanseniaspora menglaensis]